MQKCKINVQFQMKQNKQNVKKKKHAGESDHAAHK